MSHYRNNLMQELVDQQVRFAPLDKRLDQMENAERLLEEIDSGREYPYEFVAFRITGFRPEAYSGRLLAGPELCHDLRLLIEDLSESTRVDASAVGEPVLTVEQLSKRFGVSTKTINRWRDQGLVSRRYVVDGRTRVVFLQSSVDRFVVRNGKKVTRGSQFSQLSEDEKTSIVQRARRMASSTSSKPAQIIRRVARKFGRSPETVRYTIRAFDEAHPDRAVFGNTTGPLRETQKQAIYQGFLNGAGVTELAKRFSRTRSTVYRVINEMRAGAAMELNLEYIPSDEFESPEADCLILDGEAETTASSRPKQAPKGLPSYLASLYEVPLLNRDQERDLFRRMNYLKYLAAQLRELLDLQNPRSSLLDEIEHYHGQADDIKNQLIRSNLRLVVSIAKRHISSSKTFDELVSDGNISLMRAVDKFDYRRGNKFSTYASWAIMKNFARSIPAEHTFRDRYVTGQEEFFNASPDTRSDENTYLSYVDQMRQSISKILTRLDQREQSIIVSRFGLGESQRLTLEEVGQELGVTKERVRQLEVRAMGKLRSFADEEQLEFPEQI